MDTWCVCDWPTGAPPAGGLGGPTLLPPHVSAAVLQEEDHSGGYSLFPLLHIMHTIQSPGSCIVNSLLYTTCCLKLEKKFISIQCILQIVSLIWLHTFKIVYYPFVKYEGPCNKLIFWWIRNNIFKTKLNEMVSFWIPSERCVPVHVGQQLPGSPDLHSNHRQYRPDGHRIQSVFTQCSKWIFLNEIYILLCYTFNI